jgi:GntR family transcriptional regulator, transcriptional repressor for pyruvate dehydrogenase complex
MLYCDQMSDQFSKTNKFEESLQPINRTLVVDEVVDRLINIVIKENLKPGDKLPTERELAARLSIGRSSLREAIKTLCAVGALEVKRGSGIYVGYCDTSILAKPLAWSLILSQSSVDQAIEARSVIEVALAGWAAERRTDADLADMGLLLEKLEKNEDDRDAYVEYDLQFHFAIAKAAKNSMIFQVFNIFQQLLRVWMATTYQETKGAKNSMAAHRQLFEAIRLQDSKTAREIMYYHTSGAPLRSAVVRIYSETQQSPDFLSFIKNNYK